MVNYSNRNLWYRPLRPRRPRVQPPWNLWTGWRGRQRLSRFSIPGGEAHWLEQRYRNNLPAGAWNRAVNFRPNRTVAVNTAFGYNNRIINNPLELQNIEINEMGQNDINVADTSQNRPSIQRALRNRALGIPTSLNRYNRFYS